MRRWLIGALEMAGEYAGRAFTPYLAACAGVALLGSVAEALQRPDQDIAWPVTLVLIAAAAAASGVVHLACLWLVMLPFLRVRAGAADVTLYRCVVWAASLLVGAALPTALTVLLLPWQTGWEFNFAGHSVTLDSLYRGWLETLLPCVSGAFLAGRALRRGPTLLGADP